MNSISEILQQMELSNKEKKIVPSSVLYTDLMKECLQHGHQGWLVNNELRKLKNADLIKTEKTINTTAISWLPKQES